jgi:hypothetical protein
MSYKYWKTIERMRDWSSKADALESEASAGPPPDVVEDEEEEEDDEEEEEEDV